MAPPPHIERPPEFIEPKGGKVLERPNEDFVHTLFLQGAQKMVAVNQVKNAPLPMDDGRNDARSTLLPRLVNARSPPQALLRHLAQTHGDLRGVQVAGRRAGGFSPRHWRREDVWIWQML
jgi:hypothetical protein